MGIQNTGQYLMAAAVPPTIGALIADRGYGFAFAAVAIFPVLALAALPVGPGPDTELGAKTRGNPDAN